MELHNRRDKVIISFESNIVVLWIHLGLRGLFWSVFVGGLGLLTALLVVRFLDAIYVE